MTKAGEPAGGGLWWSQKRLAEVGLHNKWLCVGGGVEEGGSSSDLTAVAYSPTAVGYGGAGRAVPRQCTRSVIWRHHGLGCLRHPWDTVVVWSPTPTQWVCM